MSFVLQQQNRNIMEDENKEQYFRFYQCKTPSDDHPARKKQHLKRYQNSKILPHIIEEYNYRITNYLLIKKIISPKRDKTIMQSLQSLNRKYHSAHGNHSHTAARENNKSRENSRSNEKYKTLYNFKPRMNQSNPHKANQQSLSKFVEREGKIFHRSLSKKKSQHIKTQGQSVISNEVMSDLNKSEDRTQLTNLSKSDSKDQIILSQSNSKWRENYPLHGYCFKNYPSGYGNGPTIMLITHLQIETNPVIKGETLIQLQLVQRAAFTRSYLNVTYSNTEKTIKTDPFRYSQLPKEQDSVSSIKFCIRALKIGDFVPLRIWKYNGVESILVGTIDLPLSAYDEQENVQPTSKVEMISKKSNEQMFRKVFNGEVKHNLLTNKMFQTQSVAHVKYKVYPKRFRKREEKVMEE